MGQILSNGFNKFLRDSTEKTRILGEDVSISASTPTSFPIHERNWIHIEPNGRRLGYRKAANNDAHASVRVALHVSRCGERGSVQGLCTCPFRIARPSLLRTLPSPKGPARFLANWTTSSCNLFNGANPADSALQGLRNRGRALYSCRSWAVVPCALFNETDENYSRSTFVALCAWSCATTYVGVLLANTST